MRAIVTGGTGFVGNALVRELINSGSEVTALVRSDSKRINRLKCLPGVKLAEAKLETNNIIVPEAEYDVFYHLAWEGGRNDFDAQYANVDITLNCLRAAKKHGCKRFICTGSQAEYGETSVRISEETPLRPVTSYGAAKTAAFYLSKDLAAQLGVGFFWIRVFSVYGENDNPNTLYSKLTAALKANEIFSMQTDGMHIWNYLHENDAARALRLIGEKNIPEGAYDLASRESRPLREFTEAFRAALNPSAAIIYGDIKSSVSLNAASDKLRAAIGDYEKTGPPVL